MILTILIVVGFKHSSKITQAYGVTVCTVMNLTTILYIAVLRYHWRLAWWKIAPMFLFLIIDLLFLGAVSSKIPNGGWVALLIGFCLLALMLIWHYGEKELKRIVKSTLQTFDKSALNETLQGNNDQKTVDDKSSLPYTRSITFKDYIMKEEDDIKNSESRDSSVVEIDTNLKSYFSSNQLLPDGALVFKSNFIDNVETSRDGCFFKSIQNRDPNSLSTIC